MAMRHVGDAATPRLDDLRTARSAAASSAARAPRHRRGWYVRRALMLADVTGLSLAFVVSTLAFADRTSVGHIGVRGEIALFLVTLPIWVVLAKTLGLYERDDARADHSTADETFGVINLVTLGTWMVFVVGWATDTADPELDRAIGFWGLAVVLVSLGRIAARAGVRRLPAYSQRGIVIRAGHVGQLAARKIQQHPEYGIELVGFVDEHPRDRRPEIAHLPVLGGIEDLAELVASRDVERVIVAFSHEPDDRTMALVRSLRDQSVIVDLVPRLFELVGPRADIHLIEGLPLLTVPPARLSRSSRMLKRFVDVVGATALLVRTSPIFLVAAIRIRLESAGPVFFRQARLGMNEKPFTVLKFRTMKVDTDDAEHRAYIQSTMSAGATMDANGTYKLSRENAVTPFGRLLRKSSLDELPQLINVLRGDMSLVGPRPCIPYETEFFEPHHFDRFLVPQGITGLWQVTARAKSTFGEALEMDVAYVRGWSIGLDLRLLLRTPFALLRQRKATR
jgi:exopolysaccharide biosynthesis polyprenyl glycosylphosphotransferase